MTVSSDARTPSASVHALSDSTPPGSAPVMQPFGVATASAGVAEMPETFAPLGPIATGIAGRLRPAHPDAAVIDLAGRVERLVKRELDLILRVVSLEDAIMTAMPPQPEKAEGVLQMSFERSVEDDGTRVTTIREPAGWAAETAAKREAHEAALAARERFEQEEGVRRGLPLLNKLRSRAVSRLERWGLQLAAMRPATQAGLKAKAAALMAVAEDGVLPDDWRQRLAVSVSEDALRIICAEADARAEQDRQADGELLALAPAWEASCLRFKSSDKAHDAASDHYQHPEFPHGLLCRDTDRTGLGPYPRQDVRTGAWIFGDWNTIATLRANLASGHGSARHAEIVEAFDEWRAAEAAEEERSGLAAARAENEAAIEENQRLIRRICVTPAHTATGIDFKMRAALWSLGGIDGLAEDLRPSEVEHPGSGITMALSFLLDVARQRSGAQGKPELEDLAA